jgi:hypothetical protein
MCWLLGSFCFVRTTRVGQLKLLAQSSQTFAADRSEEAEVAHFDEAFGQYLLQEAVDYPFTALVLKPFPGNN